MAEEHLSAIIKRLENATLRLEEIARGKSGLGGASSPTAPSPARPAAGAGGKTSPAVAAFDELLSTHFQPFVDASAGIGGLVKDQATHLQAALQAQRKLIEIASASKKPDASALPDLLKPTQASIEQVVGLKDKNRPSPLFNHLSTVAEGIPALGWVVVEKTPAPFVSDMKDSAQFYANRVIKEFKDKDKNHVDWANSYINFLTELFGYVKKWHTTGLSWNPNGGDAKSFS
ncbi:hypothetical protein HK102_005552, partial [Quaeritorhiza haematococci]